MTESRTGREVLPIDEPRDHGDNQEGVPPIAGCNDDPEPEVRNVVYFGLPMRCRVVLT